MRLIVRRSVANVMRRLLREYLILPFGRHVVVVLDFGFMARHLAVQLVGQLINSGVQISV